MRHKRSRSRSKIFWTRFVLFIGDIKGQGQKQRSSGHDSFFFIWDIKRSRSGSKIFWTWFVIFIGDKKGQGQGQRSFGHDSFFFVCPQNIPCPFLLKVYPQKKTLFRALDIESLVISIIYLYIFLHSNDKSITCKSVLY